MERAELGRVQRAIVVRNKKAGKGVSDEVIVEGLRAISMEPEFVGRKGLADISLRGVSAVFVAGGDGTVARVMRRVAGSDVPLGIIPSGTANNIAKTLGIELDPAAAIESFGSAKEIGCDLGVVAGLCNEPRFFVEGLGAGLFAYVLGEHASSEHKGELGGLRLLSRILERYSAPGFRIHIDGKDVSGQYLLVAVMNMRAVGPTLMLAPDAEPGDGLHDVVLVPADERGALRSYLHKRLEGKANAKLKATRIRARTVSIHADGPRAHVDDDPATFRGGVTTRVLPGIVRLLKPRP